MTSNFDSKERILTMHPQGKSGVNILRNKYKQVKDALIAILKEQGNLTFTQLGDEMEKALAGKFEGKIMWYYTTVKLDLEARGIVERVGKRSPQKIRLIESRV
ncbi:MAG: DUF6958 family protein [Chitinophagales bacterium]